MFKIEVQEENGLWHDVRGTDGQILKFNDEEQARSALNELYPVLVKMEQYSAPKRTRVIRIWTDEEDQDWNH